LVGLLFLVFTAGAYAQNRRLGKIAVLPFSGGSTDEQEGIAELLGFTPEMMENFSVINRTSITNAARQEQSFQATSGMTNADTIAKLGNQLGADYVMAGSITSLGNRKLLIVSIVRIDVIRQVAGVYLTYDSLDELNRDETILNGMAADLVKMVRSAGSGHDMLALLPVELADGGNKEEGDALAQLLAIHLLRIGKYAVYPRTKTLDQVQSEYDTQLKSGVTRTEEAVKAGEAVNPPYVLSVISRKIGTGTRFNASIINLEGGYTIAGETEQYTSLSTGINVMKILAAKLSGEEVSTRDRTKLDKEKNAEARAAEAARRAEVRAAATDNFLKKSGIGFGGWLGGNVGGTGRGAERSVDTKREGGFTGGGDIELRLSRYFGIQTGITGFTDYAPYTPPGGEEQYEKVNFVQIPILVRLNLPLETTWVNDQGSVGEGGLFFAGFAGFGMNIVVSPDAEVNPVSMSFIAGGEAGFIFGSRVTVYMNYRYTGGIGKGSLTVDGASYDYSMKNHTLGAGLRIYLPFRRR
jgi:TolB-like protein